MCVISYSPERKSDTSLVSQLSQHKNGADRQQGSLPAPVSGCQLGPKSKDCIPKIGFILKVSSLDLCILDKVDSETVRCCGDGVDFDHMIKIHTVIIICPVIIIKNREEATSTTLYLYKATTRT